MFVPAFAGLGRRRMGPCLSCRHMVLTRRKPLLLLRFDGALLFRYAERQFDAALFQLPPRFTRDEPTAAPSPPAQILSFYPSIPIDCKIPVKP
jgi:hypothetical protein